MIVHCLMTLKDVMIRENINSVSIARNGDGLDKVHWLPIEYALRSKWNENNLQIVMCTGEVIIPPENERLTIMVEAHDSIVGGHKGITKTYRRIREIYYWDGMREDISGYVQTCDECQRRKLNRTKTRMPMTITSTPSEAFEVLEMDIVGPLPVKKKYR